METRAFSVAHRSAGTVGLGEGVVHTIQRSLLHPAVYRRAYTAN